MILTTDPIQTHLKPWPNIHIVQNNCYSIHTLDTALWSINRSTVNKSPCTLVYNTVYFVECTFLPYKLHNTYLIVNFWAQYLGSAKFTSIEIHINFILAQLIYLAHGAWRLGASVRQWLVGINILCNFITT